MRKQPNSYHCVVCGVRNDASLEVRFYNTVGPDGGPEVEARFTARPIHQGYPGRLHGGLATGILDETIGRAINAGNDDEAPTVWGVAVGLNSRFLRPVPLDVELTARGRLTRQRRRFFEGSGEIYLPDGSVAVRVEGKFMRLPLDEISGIDSQELGWRVYPDPDDPAAEPTAT